MTLPEPDEQVPVAVEAPPLLGSGVARWRLWLRAVIADGRLYQWLMQAIGAYLIWRGVLAQGALLLGAADPQSLLRGPGLVPAAGNMGVAADILEGTTEHLVIAMAPLLAGFLILLQRGQVLLGLAVCLLWLEPIDRFGHTLLAMKFSGSLIGNLQLIEQALMASGLIEVCAIGALLMLPSMAQLRRLESAAAVAPVLPVARPAAVSALAVILVMPVMWLGLELIGTLRQPLANHLSAPGSYSVGDMLADMVRIPFSYGGGVLLAAAIIALVRRLWRGGDWLTIQMTLVLIWLQAATPLFLLLQGFYRAYGSYLGLFWVLDRSGFGVIAALCWSGYLLLAPDVRRLYPTAATRADLFRASLEVKEPLQPVAPAPTLSPEAEETRTPPVRASGFGRRGADRAQVPPRAPTFGNRAAAKKFTDDAADGDTLGGDASVLDAVGGDAPDGAVPD